MGATLPSSIGLPLITTDKAMLAQAKLVQYMSPDCDRKGGNTGGQTEIDRNVDPKNDSCVDIDGRTAGIWLSRGAGVFNRRKMTAFAQTGCPANMRIDTIADRAGYSTADHNCINVNMQLNGLPGSQANNGRIMSIKFTSF